MGNCRSSIGIAKDKGKENEDKLEPPSEKTLMKKQELKDVAESDGIKWEARVTGGRILVCVHLLVGSS